MMDQSRIASLGHQAKVMSAGDAAQLVAAGSTVGLSGFTAAGYPTAVPLALAARIETEREAGNPFKLRIWTGASTGPELDGALAKAGGIEFRLPYNSDPTCREQINTGQMEYFDMHLSQVAPAAWQGILGPLDTAIIQVTGIREDGGLIPASSIGNNKTWLDRASQVILEVNHWQNPELLGMHDVYYGAALPPHRVPIPLVRPSDRIGEPCYRCDPDKIVAIVHTNKPDANAGFKTPGAEDMAIAEHLLEFLEHEVKKGRLPEHLLPLQSGVGNTANAVMAGLTRSKFENLTAYTEVIQDGMLDLLDSGKLTFASSTALCLSPPASARVNEQISQYRDRIILRSQEISNHPELIRRLGLISMNGMIEADIYGNVNSTHVMGSRIQNGIGGSGDFARNAYISIFMSASTAKGGAISAIVPHASHVDHINQDVQVIVTEQGLADLRGLSPKQKARVVIENCAHPTYRPMLADYYARSLQGSFGLQTPTLLDEALSWHSRFVKTGSMMA
jgi:succinyl-CoA:acetate CoA-transferase